MSTVLRPSPNETTRMMQDEVQRRRQLRILQVREQEKLVAIRIRRAMQEKHEKEIKNITNILQKKWNAEHKVALKKSEEKFAECLKDVGSAYESAKENAPNQALADAITEDNRKIASERGKNAVEHQREIRRLQESESIEMRKRRHMALIKEKLRAKHIARLPPPMPNPADTYLESTNTTSGIETFSSGSIPHCPGRYATVRISDHESTMSTTVMLGMPSNAVVEKATVAEAARDAREEAVKEGERIDLLQAERDRAVQECMEKAKVRHQAALEQARLDRESKELMNDLKHLKMKDALRRQHHIEYKWEDNKQVKQACQELFGPPGTRFQESELYSEDLRRQQNDPPSYLEDSSPDDETDDTATGWSSVQDQQAKPQTRGRALNRLLKQIEQQRQQKKNGNSDSGSSVREMSVIGNLNSISAINGETQDGAENQVEDLQETSQPETKPKETFPVQDLLSLGIPQQKGGDFINQGIKSVPYDITRGHDTGEVPQKPGHVLTDISAVNVPGKPSSPKVVQENVPRLSPKIGTSFSQKKVGKAIDGSNLSSKSESLLERSLQSMKTDEALLKSVKDFQERLLQQHKSCAKIQEQIQRLEQKKASIDCMVADVTKPKNF